MKEEDIRKYAGLMKELELTGLEITEDNRVVRLERSIPAAVKEVIQENTVSNAPAKEGGKDYISVKSPLVGVFYGAPAENAKPYVSIGDRVEKGTVLCIIEAMKLMNEIASDYSGIISEICVTNGQMVEYGTELFRMKEC